MKIGLLSDAHGNVTGLIRCLEFFNSIKVDKIFFLGDIVGYFPWSVHAFEMLQSAHAFCLLGNHDAMLSEHIELDERKNSVYQIKQSKNKISRQYLQQISTRLPYWHGKIDGKKLLLVHGSPWDPLRGYIYPDSDLQRFSTLSFDFIFMGHTHRPFIQQSGAVTVVNVGSCGLPRDQGNLASCAIFDTKTGECEIIRISFNAQALIKKYKNCLHASVVSSLLRESPHQIIGKIMEM